MCSRFLKLLRRVKLLEYFFSALLLHTGHGFSGGMLGGLVAEEGQFPFFAYFTSENGAMVCGASLLSPEWIVTAAHCFTNTSSGIAPFSLNDRRYLVYMGTIRSLSKLSDVNKIRRVVVHPEYAIEFIDDDPKEHLKRIDYDIALAQLERKYKLTKYVAPVLLPERRDLDDDLPRMCKSGFIVGIRPIADASPPYFEVVYAVIHTQNRTQLKVPKAKSCIDTLFYSEIEMKIAGPLTNEFGGPFSCSAGNGSGYASHVLHGIMIRGYNSTIHKTHVTVFEYVDRYIDFIRKHVKRSLRVVNSAEHWTTRIATDLNVFLCLAYYLSVTNLFHILR